MHMCTHTHTHLYWRCKCIHSYVCRNGEILPAGLACWVGVDTDFDSSSASWRMELKDESSEWVLIFWNRFLNLIIFKGTNGPLPRSKKGHWMFLAWCGSRTAQSLTFGYMALSTRRRSVLTYELLENISVKIRCTMALVSYFLLSRAKWGMKRMSWKHLYLSSKKRFSVADHCIWCGQSYRVFENQS